MTGTPFCLLPVTGLNGAAIGDGKPGRITEMLLERWSDNVGVDVVKQIKAFNAELKSSKAAPTPYRFVE